MTNLLAEIEVIAYYSKQLHYTLSGPAFYGMHLLMDRTYKKMRKFSDRLKEVSFLGRGYFPPAEIKVVELTLEKMRKYQPENDPVTLVMLKTAFFDLLVTVLVLKDGEQIDEATLNIFGDLCEHVQNMLGLLNNTLAPSTDNT